MSLLLSALTNKWTWMGLLILALGGVIAVERFALRSADARIAAQEAEIGKLREGVAERDAAIATQNKAVEGWKAAGIQNALRASRAESRVAALLKQSHGSIQAILETPIVPATEVVPQPVAQLCEGGVTWLRTEARSLSSSW